MGLIYGNDISQQHSNGSHINHLNQWPQSKAAHIFLQREGSLGILSCNCIWIPPAKSLVKIQDILSVPIMSLESRKSCWSFRRHKTNNTTNPRPAGCPSPTEWHILTHVHLFALIPTFYILYSLIWFCEELALYLMIWVFLTLYLTYIFLKSCSIEISDL